jgi:hypothetical protein
MPATFAADLTDAHVSGGERHESAPPKPYRYVTFLQPRENRVSLYRGTEPRDREDVADAAGVVSTTEG